MLAALLMVFKLGHPFFLLQESRILLEPGDDIVWLAYKERYKNGRVYNTPEVLEQLNSGTPIKQGCIVKYYTPQVLVIQEPDFLWQPVPSVPETLFEPVEHTERVPEVVRFKQLSRVMPAAMHTPRFTWPFKSLTKEGLSANAYSRMGMMYIRMKSIDSAVIRAPFAGNIQIEKQSTECRQRLVLYSRQKRVKLVLENVRCFMKKALFCSTWG